MTAPEPTPAAEVSVTPSSAFPFELLLVSDEQEQHEQEQVESKAHSTFPPAAHGDALSMIEQRLAVMQAGIKNMPLPSLSPRSPAQARAAGGGVG